MACLRLDFADGSGWLEQGWLFHASVLEGMISYLEYPLSPYPEPCSWDWLLSVLQNLTQTSPLQERVPDFPSDNRAVPSCGLRAPLTSSTTLRTLLQLFLYLFFSCWEAFIHQTFARYFCVPGTVLMHRIWRGTRHGSLPPISSQAGGTDKYGIKCSEWRKRADRRV